MQRAILTVTVYLLAFAASAVVATEKPSFGIVYINDGADYMGRGIRADVAGLGKVVDGYADAGHKLLIYGVRSGLLTFNYKSRLPGEYFGEGYSDEYLREMPSIRHMRDVIKSYFDQGIDPFGEIVKQAKARGIKILAQIRPNNFNRTKSDHDRVINGRFYYEHPEYRIEGGYNWDYAKPVVRQYFLDVVKEILERYNIDGIDIDFTQGPPFFHDSEPNKKQIMNDFLRAIRTELDQVGKARGKQILFTGGIRLDPPEMHWKPAGLDLSTWAKEGMVDLITVYHLMERAPVPGLRDLAEYLEIFRGSKCLFYHAQAHLPEFDKAYLGIGAINRGGPFHISQEYFAALERMARAAGLDGVVYRNYQIYPSDPRISAQYSEFRSYNVDYFPQVLPEHAANLWTANPEGMAVVDNATLRLGGYPHLGNRIYERDPAMLNVGSSEVTFQAHVKVIATKGYRDCFLEVANGQRHALLELFTDKVRLSDVGLARFAEAKLDLNEFQTLRLTLDKTGTARVYVGASDRATLKLQLNNFNPYWRIAFGNGASSSLSLWQNIHYTLEGAFAPSTHSFPKGRQKVSE